MHSRPSFIVVTVLILCSSDLSSFCNGEENSERTGEVIPGIAEFIDNRDALYQRYAYQIVGESWGEEFEKPPRFAPFCFMKIVDSKSEFDFDGYGRLLSDPHPLSRQKED